MGMLPKNKLRSQIIAKLKVYEGPAHPHGDELRGKESLLSTERLAPEHLIK